MSSLPIVIIEDDDDDYQILVHALLEECSRVQPHRISNRIEWEQFVRHPVVKPVMFITDYHLWGQTAIDIIKLVKTNPNLTNIPVVVWSGSAIPQNISESYQQGAASFIPKLSRMEEMKSQMKAFCLYWFDVVKLVTS